MRALWILLLSAGCATTMAVPTAVHPTAAATEKSVGVAVGGAYGFSEGDGGASALMVPHSEGWIRLPVGAGQVGVHLGPNIINAGFRFDAVPMAEGGGVGIAIEPMVGGGYLREHQESSSGGTDQDEEALVLVAGLSGIILIPAGAGHAYVVPKFAYENVQDLDAEDSNSLYVLGLSLGVDLGGGASVELAVHRIDDLEDEVPDSEPIWLFVPTFGLRH
jgi:hypothetical protein